MAAFSLPLTFAITNSPHTRTTKTAPRRLQSTLLVDLQTA
jgi:hypothetical protein